MLIDGLKLIFKTGCVDVPDDPSYPWRLEASFRPDGFMSVAFIALYGGEERLIVRGQTREALEQLVEVNKLCGHPRLRRLAIYRPAADDARRQDGDVA